MNQKKMNLRPHLSPLRLLRVSWVRRVAWLRKSSVLLLDVTRGQGGAVLRLVVSLGWIGYLTKMFD